jgi:hypothetical protein
MVASWLRKTAAAGLVFQLFRKLMPTTEIQALILSPTRTLFADYQRN